MELDDLLKELDNRLKIYEKKVKDGTLLVECELPRETTNCCYCGMKSDKIHSRYIRTISDLPMQSYPVKLVITCYKYFCHNKQCTHKTYAPKLSFAGRHAIRTKRLDESICQIGLKISSMEASRQLKKNCISISNSTVLRLLKKNPI